ISSSGHSTPSPPASPLRSPRYRHGRKPGRFSPFQPGRTVAHHVAWLLLSVLLRRQGIFLFAPLIYISGMLIYMGTVSFDVVPLVKHRPAPGSVYRSPQVYEKLKIEMNEDYSSADAVSHFDFFGFTLGFYDSLAYFMILLFKFSLHGCSGYFVDMQCSCCGRLS
ncbi:hypothetical protein Goklo_008819, partial [Gossypium klotzschianum]|nr:hypothetical protein [Gossypium klotzschianum]